MPNDLTPLHIYVLLHLKRAKVDYAKMMAKMTGVDLEKINSCIRDLIELGLVERDSGSAIKRSKAKFKKAFEVRKHHTYYRLTKEGERFVRRIDDDWLKEFFDKTVGKGAFEKIMNSNHVSRNDELFERFLSHGLIRPSGKKTKLLKLILSFK